jgi:hypothetical protein
MSFPDLHAAIQGRDCPISTKWLKERAIELSSITRIQEQWSSILDESKIRGFYIEGPLGPPIPLAAGESLITLSRAMVKGPQGQYWRRLVFTKELMHVFDTEEEKASSDAQFDLQIQKFRNPTALNSPQYQAESKALWRALGCLCPEVVRVQLKADLAANKVSWEIASAMLRLPVPSVRLLVSAGFEENIAASM